VRFNRLDAVCAGPRTSRENNQCAKKKRERRNGCRRDKQQRPYSHRNKPDHHRFFVADPVDQFSRGQRKYEIRGKERKLDQHHFRVVQIENGLQMRDQNVVQRGEESPHEEQRGDRG
jgi:hypothetical protein